MGTVSAEKMREFLGSLLTPGEHTFLDSPAPYINRECTYNWLSLLSSPWGKKVLELSRIVYHHWIFKRPYSRSAYHSNQMVYEKEKGGKENNPWDHLISLHLFLIVCHLLIKFQCDLYFLLQCNSHNIKLTILKCTIQWHRCNYIAVQRPSLSSSKTPSSLRPPSSHSLLSPTPVPDSYQSFFCLCGFTSSGYFT